MSSDAGTVSEGPYTYDAYGQGAPLTGVPFKYTGRRLDAETGLYYYRARYYSASLGRFLQTDPIGYRDQMNLYGYAGSDPLNATDPSGTKIKCADSNCKRLQEYINKYAHGYKFNEKKELVRSRKGYDGGYRGGKIGMNTIGGGRSYYEARLDAAIASDDTITLSVSSTATIEVMGKPLELDVDGNGHGALTTKTADGYATTLSGSDYTGVRDGNGEFYYKDPSGNPIQYGPAEILMHELLGHSIPGVAGGDTGNAVANENKARAQLGLPLRASEPHHGETGTID
jgi:RHS repeat-associated protein